MDPLSITASILAVISAAGKASEGALSIISAWRSAPDEMFAIVNEISDIQLVLQSATEALREFPLMTRNATIFGENHAPRLSHLVTRARDVLQELTALFETRLLRIEFEDGADRIKFMRRRWLVERQRVQRLRTELRSLRTNISTLVSAMTTSQLAAVRVRIEEIHVMNYHSGRRVHGWQDSVSANLARQTDMLESLVKQSSTPHLDPESAGPLNPLQSLDAEGAAIQMTCSQLQPSLIPCSEYCGCSCHITNTARTPGLFRSALGSLFLGYTAVPMLTSPCNTSRCRGAARGAVTVSYLFPPWFWSKRILAGITFLTGSAPEFVLRISNVRPADAEIFLMAWQGDTSGIRGLLRSGRASPYDCDPTGLTALHHAAHLDKIDTAELLLQFGADRNVGNHDSVTPMDNAWDKILSGKTSHNSHMRLLFADNAEEEYLTSRKFTAFHKAVLSIHGQSTGNLGRIAKVCGLADLDKPDKEGITPLGWAAGRGDIEAVKCLLRLGADPSRADTRLYSPLMRSLSPECSKLLIDAGATVDFRDNTGQTALMFAVHSPLCVEVLLDKKADINASSESGFTPLFFSIMFNAPESLRILLSRGANYRVPIPGHSSIAHYAIKHASVRCLEVLSEFGLQGVDNLTPDETDLKGAGTSVSGETQADLRREAVQQFVKSVNTIYN